MSEQGIDVVVCSIAMYDEIRKWNRENIENYKEVYIKVTQLYSSGRTEVVGVDLPFDEPRDADAVIQNDGQETPDAIIARLWSAFGLEEAQ